VTADPDMADALRSMRNNGYGRDRTVQSGHASVMEDDGDACFALAGFNFKPTSFAAALLHGQVSRLGDYLTVRRRAALAYTQHLEAFEALIELPAVRPPCRHSWFAYPLVLREGVPFSRRDLRAFLRERGIDSRPLLGGSLAAQPFMQLHRHRSGQLTHAQKAHERGLMIGLHHAITEQQVQHVLAAFTDFFAGLNPSSGRP
jgi:CDP-4-dehydro-6-deoxyglucose reductase, E1